MFEALGYTIREEVVTILFHAQVEAEDASQLEQQPQAPQQGRLQYQHETAAGAAAMGGAAEAFPGDGAISTSTPVVNSEHENIGRNDPCWCGSGKKFKKCHGA
jgi:preprotein translocase subunit SecA